MAESIVTQAEEALVRGHVADASSLARTVLQQQTAALSDKERAINVQIQADFHFHNQLTDFDTLLEESGLCLEQLPVKPVMLWGVVAVELQAADAARGLLRRYLDAKNFGEGSDVTREDAMALSRLYAVQLLSNLCGDFQAAADWLADGGAGLSDEQQELLLLEVDEAEDMAQEEHVDLWTSQDAAQAAHLGIGAAAFHENSYSDTAPDCAGATYATDAGSGVGSHASAAAAAMHELGPSVSGGLSSCSLHPADDASHEHACHEHASHEQDPGPSHEHAGSCSDTARQTPAAAAAAAAGAQLEAAVAAAAAAESPAAVAAVASPVAAVAVRGLGDSDRVPSSPSLASWRRSPDELAVQDQGSQAGANDTYDNPYVTMTGAVDDQGYGLDAAAAAAAATAAAAAAAAGGGSDGRSGASLAGSPEKSGKRQGLGGKGSVGVKSRLRDAASDVASAAVAAVMAAVTPVAAVAESASAAPVVNVPKQGDEQQQEQQEKEAAEAEEEQQQEQQGPGSWFTSYTAWASEQANWASSKASETWQSQPVQDTLKALNLQDVPPWELAGGAAAAMLLTYTLYRNRRRVRRAAADFAVGVSQTARMGMGMSVNPMAAVPGTSHMR